MRFIYLCFIGLNLSMAYLSRKDGDISRVFISVETIPLLTFVPQRHMQSHVINKIHTDQSNELINSTCSGSSDSIISIDQTQTDVTDYSSDQDIMQNSCQHPELLSSVEIIIEDCDTQEGTDDDSSYSKHIDDQENNNIDVTGKWQQRTALAKSLVEQRYTDNTAILPLAPIDEERRSPLLWHKLSISTSEEAASKEGYGDALSPNELEKIKGIAKRLNLQTRRGSYVTWRNKLSRTLSNELTSIESNESSYRERLTSMNSVDSTHSCTSDSSNLNSLTFNKSDDEKLNSSVGPTGRISEALSFIKSELVS